MAGKSLPRLSIGDAAAAIMVLPDGRFLMQLRDNRPDIWYPGHWGCFGGAVDAGEDVLAALRRELREELEFKLRRATLVSRYVFDFEPAGLKKIRRDYFLVALEDGELERMVLHEGVAMEAMTYERLTSGIPVTPYDAFAIHFHHNRARVFP